MIPISFTRNIFITTLLIFITLLLISLTTLSDPARRDPENIQYAHPHGMTRVLSTLKSFAGLRDADGDIEDVMVVHPDNWPIDPEALNERLRKELQEQLMATIRKSLPRDLAMSDRVDPKNSERFFMLYVPEHTPELRLDTRGGSGDIGLYVMRGGIPSTSRYDCRSIDTGTRQRCAIRSPEEGVYYVMLRGNASYYGVSVTGAYHTPGHIFPSIAITPVNEVARARVEAPNT